MSLVYAPIFESVYGIAKELPADDQAALFMACCQYAFEGAEPDCEGIVRAVFENVAKPSIDKTVERAERNRSIARNRSTVASEKPVQVQPTTSEAPEHDQTDTRVPPETHQTSTSKAPEHDQMSFIEVPEADKNNDLRPKTYSPSSPNGSEGGSRGDGSPQTPRPSKRFSPPSVQEVQEYGEQFCRDRGIPPGAFDAESFVDYWTSVGWKRGRTPMKDWKATVRTWIKRDHPEAAKGGPADDEFSAYD